MSQLFLDDFRMDALLEHEGRCKMAEVVKVDVKKIIQP
jgi:hypothetical protein